MISLREINKNNLGSIIELSVADHQSKLVLSNAISIAQSKVQEECIPLAIYSGDTPVGFLMYCIDSDDDEYWLYRLMIDQNHQGKGYSKKAMNLLLDIIKQDKSRNKMFLGVDKSGGASIKLYESLGFKYTGQVFGQEHIMVLDY